MGGDTFWLTLIFLLGGGGTGGGATDNGWELFAACTAVSTLLLRNADDALIHDSPRGVERTSEGVMMYKGGR